VCGLGGEAAVGRLRSYSVVLAPPALDHRTGLGKAGEDLLVQALVAKPADEALHEGVLGWLGMAGRSAAATASVLLRRMSTVSRSMPFSV